MDGFRFWGSVHGRNNSAHGRKESAHGRISSPMGGKSPTMGGKVPSGRMISAHGRENSAHGREKSVHGRNSNLAQNRPPSVRPGIPSMDGIFPSMDGIISVRTEIIPSGRNCFRPWTEKIRPSLGRADFFRPWTDALRPRSELIPSVDGTPRRAEFRRAEFGHGRTETDFRIPPCKDSFRTRPPLLGKARKFSPAIIFSDNYLNDSSNDFTVR